MNNSDQRRLESSSENEIEIQKITPRREDDETVFRNLFRPARQCPPIWNSNDDSLCVLKFDIPEFLILATLYSDRFHHLSRISSALLMSQWTTTMLWSIHGGCDVRLDNQKLLKLKNCRLTLFVTSSFLQLCMIKHDSHSCFLIVRLFSHVTQPMESAVVVIKTRPNLEARENRTERH